MVFSTSNIYNDSSFDFNLSSTVLTWDEDSSLCSDLFVNSQENIGAVIVTNLEFLF